MMNNGNFQFKQHLLRYFQTKDLVCLKYFLPVKVAHPSTADFLDTCMLWILMLSFYWDNRVTRLSHHHSNIHLVFLVVGQFLQASYASHRDVVTQILEYIKEEIDQGFPRYDPFSIYAAQAFYCSPVLPYMPSSKYSCTVKGRSIP